MSNTDFSFNDPGGTGVNPGDLAGLGAKEPTKITGEEDIAKLPAGEKFLTPDGKTRQKPYELKTESDIDNIPEGAWVQTPDGKTRQKPTFEPLNYTSQTLYDMSVTKSEKRKSLERSYPGGVQEDQDGLYVKDGEKLRRPGRGGAAWTGGATAMAAPVVGGVLGALGLGAASGGVGAAVGGAGGSILGQSINDIVLQLAGVYDRTGVEEAANLGKAGMMGMAGAGVGRGIAAFVPAAKAGVSSVGQMLPSAVAHFLGAGPELTAARQLAEKGVKVPPSAWAHEAPHLQNVVEVFDPATLAMRTAFTFAEPRAYHAVVRFGNRLLHIGGYGVDAGGLSRSQASYEVTDFGP